MKQIHIKPLYLILNSINFIKKAFPLNFHHLKIITYSYKTVRRHVVDSSSKFVDVSEQFGKLRRQLVEMRNLMIRQEKNIKRKENYKLQ